MSASYLFFKLLLKPADTNQTSERLSSSHLITSTMNLIFPSRCKLKRFLLKTQEGPASWYTTASMLDSWNAACGITQRSRSFIHGLQSQHRSQLVHSHSTYCFHVRLTDSYNNSVLENNTGIIIYSLTIAYPDWSTCPYSRLVQLVARPRQASPIQRQ